MFIFQTTTLKDSNQERRQYQQLTPDEIKKLEQIIENAFKAISPSSLNPAEALKIYFDIQLKNIENKRSGVYYRIQDILDYLGRAENETKSIVQLRHEIYQNFRNNKDRLGFYNAPYTSTNLTQSEFFASYGASNIFIRKTGTYPNVGGQLNTVYNRFSGNKSFYSFSIPFDLHYELLGMGVGQPPFFGRLPRPFPPSLKEEKGLALRGFGTGDEIYNYYANNFNQPISSRTTLEFEAKAWQPFSSLNINYARINYNKVFRDERITSWLDATFLKNKQPVGETIVFLDKGNRTVQALYNDGKNWFDAGLVFQNGKPVAGSAIQGELNNENIFTSFFWNKQNGLKDGDVGYVVLSLPKVDSNKAVAFKKDSNSVKEFDFLSAGDIGYQIGYFSADPNSLFLAQGKKIEGATAGFFGKDWFFKGLLGFEGGKATTYGAKFSYSNSYVSGYYRNSDKKSVNLEAGTVLNLGDDWTVSSGFRLVSNENRRPLGSGTVELKKKDGFRIAFGLDNINRWEFQSYFNSYVANLPENASVLDLINKTQEYINSVFLQNASRPVKQLEFGYENDWTVGISQTLSQNSKGYGVFFKKGESITVLQTVDDLSKATFTYSYDKENKKITFQVSEENKKPTQLSVGTKWDNSTYNLSLLKGGWLAKYAYENPNIIVGGAVGKMPNAPSSEYGRNNTLIYAEFGKKNILPTLIQNDWLKIDADWLKTDVLIYPKDKIVGVGLKYEMGNNNIQLNLGINAFFVQNRPTSYTWRFGFSYRK